MTVAAYAKDPLTPLDGLLQFAKDTRLAHVHLAWEHIVRSPRSPNGSHARGAADFSPRGLSTRDSTPVIGNSGVNTILECLHGEGLELAGIDATALDGLDGETFKKQTDDICVQMRAAGRLGAGNVTLTAGPRDPANFAHVVDGLRRLTVLADRVGVALSIRNVCDSSVEQLDDLHRLFHEVGAKHLTLDLDMAEFQAAVVKPYDAAISFAYRVARIRVCDINLEATLATLQRDGFTGPVLVALEDGPRWAGGVIETARRH